MLTFKDTWCKHLKQLITKATLRMTDPNDMLLSTIELTKLIKAEQLADYLLKHKAFGEELLKCIKDTPTNKPFQGSKTPEDNIGRRAIQLSHG